MGHTAKQTVHRGWGLDEIAEKYVSLGKYTVKVRMLVFDSPAGSVTKLYSK